MAHSTAAGRGRGGRPAGGAVAMGSPMAGGRGRGVWQQQQPEGEGPRVGRWTERRSAFGRTPGMGESENAVRWFVLVAKKGLLR